MSDAIENFKNHKKEILFIELAGLLHDIGKLSKKFLEYRQTWWGESDGWYNDPHDSCFLLKHENHKEVIPEEFYTSIDQICDSVFEEDSFSIQRAVNTHTKVDENQRLMKMLKAADSNDSQYDRNNPLFSSEQRIHGKIFKSNVFGFEHREAIDFENQEILRKRLYKNLGAKLPAYFKDFSSERRREVFQIIREAFDQGVSDTTRPNNDTTLWEHSYAVASILKAITVHNIFHKNTDDEMFDRDSVEYGILGVGWDGLRFISQGQKIGDIASRKHLLKKVKKKIAGLIECTFPVGNTVYEDDDGIFFIVPRKFDKKPFKEIFDAIENKIYTEALKITDGELHPHLALCRNTNSLTPIVAVIGDMKKKAAFPIVGTSRCFELFEEKLKDESNGLVCPICGLRTYGSGQEEASDAMVCKVCLKRRKNASKPGTKASHLMETIFMDEIIGKERRKPPRAALIVAQFGLDQWLDGKMIRSLFVSPAPCIDQEIKSLGEIESFEKENEIDVRNQLQKNEGYDFEKIKGDIDAILNYESADKDTKQRAENTAFLYGYGRMSKVPWKKEEFQILMNNFKNSIKNAKREMLSNNGHPMETVVDEFGYSESERRILYNVVSAKSPTPSTILDVWLTTQKFFEQIIHGNILDEAFPESYHRLRVKSQKTIPLDKMWRGTIDAVSSKNNHKKFELLYKGLDEFEIVGEIFEKGIAERFTGSKFTITDKNQKANGTEISVLECLPGQRFKPYRIITISPKVFMAIVPGEKAQEITRKIHQKYMEHFGKVFGRLPLSIGNVFFKHRTPMFVVLDSGRRMLDNFETLIREEKRKKFKVDDAETEKETGILQLCANTSLGKEENSYLRELKWNLPYGLEDYSNDYHHPYFFVESEKDRYKERSTYFEVIQDDNKFDNVVHFSQIEKQDTLLLYPNYFDFEFLDTNAKRLNLGFAADTSRRFSTVAPILSKPFLVEEVESKIMEVWKMLQGFEKLTDSKLRNLQSLWLSKLCQWEVDLEKTKKNHALKNWMELVKASIEKELNPEAGSDERKLLLETIENGLFFDILDLHFSILKQKIRQ